MRTISSLAPRKMQGFFFHVAKDLRPSHCLLMTHMARHTDAKVSNGEQIIIARVSACRRRLLANLAAPLAAVVLANFLMFPIPI